MKKKILSLFILFMGVLVLTGCGSKTETEEKGKTIKLDDTTLNYVTTFTVPSGTDFEKTDEITGGRYKEIVIKSEKENLRFDMYYTETGSASYDSLKKSRSTNKYYKEYKFGKYDAYAYSDYSDNLYLDIKLEELTDKKIIRDIFVSIDTINFDNSDVVFDMFNRDNVQKLFKSIEFTK